MPASANAPNPASAAPSRRASRAMSEALGTDEGCRPVRETSPGDFHVHDRLDPTALVDAVALHAARDAKRHAVRRMRARPCRAKWHGGRDRAWVSSTPRSPADISHRYNIKNAPRYRSRRLPYAPSLRRSLRESQLLPEEHRRGARMATTEPITARAVMGSSLTIFPSGNA